MIKIVGTIRQKLYYFFHYGNNVKSKGYQWQAKHYHTNELSIALKEWYINILIDQRETKISGSHIVIRIQTTKNTSLSRFAGLPTDALYFVISSQVMHTKLLVAL